LLTNAWWKLVDSPKRHQRLHMRGFVCLIGAWMVLSHALSAREEYEKWSKSLLHQGGLRLKSAPECTSFIARASGCSVDGNKEAATRHHVASPLSSSQWPIITATHPLAQRDRSLVVLTLWR
jgi:hypothetical protein